MVRQPKHPMEQTTSLAAVQTFKHEHQRCSGYRPIRSYRRLERLNIRPLSSYLFQQRAHEPRDKRTCLNTRRNFSPGPAFVNNYAPWPNFSIHNVTAARVPMDLICFEFAPECESTQARKMLMFNARFYTSMGVNRQPNAYLGNSAQNIDFLDYFG